MILLYLHCKCSAISTLVTDERDKGIEIANTEEEIKENDHVFRIVDDVSVYSKIEEDPLKPQRGYAKPGDKVVYLHKFFTSKHARHEIGHSAFLSHPVGEKKNGNFGTPKIIIGQSSEGFVHYRRYQDSELPNNMMIQGLNKNKKLTLWQFNKMMYYYEKEKKINTGVQKY